MARKPLFSGVGVVRIKLIRDRRLERLVMSWERAVLQTSGHVNPTQAILVQDEWRIPRNCVKAFCAYLRFIVRRFSLYKSRNIDAGPFFRVPPN